MVLTLEWVAETADDQVQMAELLQTLMQVGAGEGIGQAFLHHRLVAERRQSFDEASARALRVEQATGDAQVAHVQHRGTEVACGIEQGGRSR